ncbi:MAG: hypothetical protein V3U78_08700 [Thiotrichaceae bacterium]
MTDLSLFFYEIFLSLTLSSIVLLTLATPLRKLLQNLSHSNEQAFFWLAYTRTMLFISPLLMVILVGALADAEGLAHIKVTLISALGGLLLGLMIIGRKMYSPASMQCDIETQRATPHTSAH